ncbi:MAG: pyridoxine 5'-phosphate synthase [Puniceicoccales bacterium]|jgi:pyridoxine 5-phosphate synthase|nr:pyridoxine 5'-phosphate synthase [Puniceicoccales bacterium]
MTRSTILLGVNIDHTATLRQARFRDAGRTCGAFVEPDPVLVALLAEQAGADGITVHLREDRRHIQERDVLRLRENIQTRLNLEMACNEAIVDFAIKLRPDCVCLVPENRSEVTTEGGLDLIAGRENVARVVARMNDAGIPASLFIAPDPTQIAVAAELHAPWIELHTGAFANAYYDPALREKELLRLRRAAEQASLLDIAVNAGHGINYTNIREVLTLPHLHELNIGHSILSRAVLYGIGEAVRTMKARIRGE